MTTRTIITLGQVCEYYRVDLELIRDFADFGLYPTVSLDGELGIEERSLPRLEKVISLHQALGINKEGIDVVLDLKARIESLQGDVELLRSEVAALRLSARDGDPESLKSLGLLIDVDD
jgi:chaperone modulatory protein CbpM